MTIGGWPVLQLRRLADCWDYLRVPLNAEERAERPGDVPYWGANTVQGYVDTPLIDQEVVLLGEDGAPFFDRDRPVAFHSAEPIWPNNHIHVLKPHLDVDARWLAYALNSVDYSLHVGGSTRDKLTQGAMLQIPLAVPDHPEQHAIADFLDRETARIDTLIAKQEQLIETLRERRAAVIDGCFTDDGGTRLRLKSVLQFAQTGPFGTQLSASEYVNDGVPVVNPSHIHVGAIVADPGISVTKEKANDLARHRLRQGDVVLGRKGEVDKSALVMAEHSGMICGSDSLLLRPSATMSSGYLWWFLQSATAHWQLEQVAVGSTVSGLSQRAIAQVELPVPSIAEQHQVATELFDRTSKIDSLIAKAEQFITLAKERRSALITAAVTGQIDVTDAA